MAKKSKKSKKLKKEFRVFSSGSCRAINQKKYKGHTSNKPITGTCKAVNPKGK